MRFRTSFHTLVSRLSLVAGCWIASLGCSAAQTEEGEEPQGAAAIGAAQLALESNDDSRVYGVFAKKNETVAHFESLLDKGRTASVLKLGAHTFEWTRDPTSGVFTLDGHGAKLDKATLEKLAQLRAALLQKFEAERVANGHLRPAQGLLLGQVEWLAAGDEGAEVPPIRLDMQMIQSTEESAYGYSEDYVTCLPKNVSRTFYARSDGGSTRTGSFVVNATKTGTSVRGSGWDGRCMGQCGGGCQHTWENGTFQDCFDHDFCTFYFTNCSLQWWQAADDFVAKAIDSCG